MSRDYKPGSFNLISRVMEKGYFNGIDIYRRVCYCIDVLLYYLCKQWLQ